MGPDYHILPNDHFREVKIRKMYEFSWITEFNFKVNRIIEQQTLIFPWHFFSLHNFVNRLKFVHGKVNIRRAAKTGLIETYFVGYNML